MALLDACLPEKKQLTKAIYFDKPPQANWSVPWHQDLMIHVTQKHETEGFSHWRIKSDVVVVQPPREVLANTVTLRIHLDDCTAANGALRCIAGSHKQGIISMSDWQYNGGETVCEASAGSVLMMNPLTLHASQRSDHASRRRVLHLEFCDNELPQGVHWKESLLF